MRRVRGGVGARRTGHWVPNGEGRAVGRQVSVVDVVEYSGVELPLCDVRDKTQRSVIPRNNSYSKWGVHLTGSLLFAGIGLTVAWLACCLA